MTSLAQIADKVTENIIGARRWIVIQLQDLNLGLMNSYHGGLAPLEQRMDSEMILHISTHHQVIAPQGGYYLINPLTTNKFYHDDITWNTVHSSTSRLKVDL